MATGDELAQAVVGNSDVYVDEELYFRLLQDRGQPMSDKERGRFANSKSRAAVKGKIHFVGLMYPSLYKLAEAVYKKMADHTIFSPSCQTIKTKPRQST